MLVVADVEASSRFYCELIGLESGHGGPEYEQLLCDGELVMQLHDDQPDDAHGPLADNEHARGNGVLVWFEVDDFDSAVARARSLDAKIELDVRTNPNARQQEIWLRDPDGYLVVVAGPSEYRPRSTVAESNARAKELADDMMGMTNEQVLDFNKGVIAEFREHLGVMPEGSMFHGNPTLLLNMTGAKSGRALTSPLSYATDDDAFIVMASAGGSETTPSWAYNLRAHPSVTLEVLDESFEAVATEVSDDEHDRVFGVMTEQLPRFANYQEAVERKIPLFRLTRS